jgi:hypothetical protein
MKRVITVLAVLVAALAASNASARQAPHAVGAVDPLRQVLQKSDLPAGALYESELGLDSYLKEPLKAAGLSGYAGRYYGAKYSETKGFLQVSGVVITVADAAAARTAFAIVRKARLKLVRNSSDWRPLALPRYGNEQTARLNVPGGEGIGIVELIVRKNRVVWMLHVTLERRQKPPVAEIVAGARTYAAKQQRRVGAG